MRVVVTEAAELDINGAAVWYERETVGLGSQFLDAVAATLKRIENNPQQFPLVYGDKRRALLKRFPYGLFFSSRARCRGSCWLFPRPQKSEGVAISALTC